MASAFTHSFVGLIIGKVLKGRPVLPWRFWFGLALVAALPDVDVVAFRLGIPYDSPWGHRGFTHSLVFAAFLGWLALEILRLGQARFSKGWWTQWACLFLSAASHGFLDAMTNGGMGVAFFWPFDNTRHFLPWRPILVSPVTVQGFFHERAFAILWSEFLWVWLPVAGFFLLFEFVKKVGGAKGDRD